MSEAELTEYWDDIRPLNNEMRYSHRPGSIHPKWDPKLPKLQDWVDKIGKEPSPILLVEGPTFSHRLTIYRMVKTIQDKLSDTWIEQGIVNNLTQRAQKVRSIGSITPHDWDLLWNLLTLETLEINEPVRTLVDQGHLCTELFKALWEARFRLDEGQEVKTFVQAISKWMTAETLTPQQKGLLGSLGIQHSVETTYERLDVLFFLITLAHQNDLLSNLIFVLDGLDKVVTQGVGQRKLLLKELFDFCIAAERWSRLGAPIGFMLGYSAEHKPLDSIQRSNLKLGQKLKQYGSV